MSFVHEACLVRWLTQQNIRICELCKQPFNFQEEFGSPWYIISKNLKYLISDKRRVLKLCIYSLYLYLFSKRFIILLKYFKHLLLKLCFFWQKHPVVPKGTHNFIN
jgi:hypothetical protein